MGIAKCGSIVRIARLGRFAFGREVAPIAKNSRRLEPLAVPFTKSFSKGNKSTLSDVGSLCRSECYGSARNKTQIQGFR